ncbi:hypothetical protein K505DRAFT_1771 [Melanomma pulvis-pyrius CBS 109.77]|uniref:Uncharacterized protein n=1 Tax=Melanomma pulvis-pyrius CBS 109.77 TaxID=1314802 RepID=A0A6A6XY02_9PLEO|nr:hypothetical protein K505DRAFT_1771 [Melanomma pulvis-pyrius CBS 109.77]
MPMPIKPGIRASRMTPSRERFLEPTSLVFFLGCAVYIYLDARHSFFPRCKEQGRTRSSWDYGILTGALLAVGPCSIDLWSCGCSLIYPRSIACAWAIRGRQCLSERRFIYVRHAGSHSFFIVKGGDLYAT